MSAVRMVAYGVIELPAIPNLKYASPIPADWERQDELRRAAMHKRDEIVKLVQDELKTLDLLLQPAVSRINSRFGPNGPWVLHGQPEGLYKKPQGFVTRPLLCSGTFAECCIEAAKVLDQLEPGR